MGGKKTTHRLRFWLGIEPPGVVSLQVAEVASGSPLDARFLPEERNDTLVDAFGLAKGRHSSLLHDLKPGHFCRFMRIVCVHDLACSRGEALYVGTHVAD